MPIERKYIKFLVVGAVVVLFGGIYLSGRGGTGSITSGTQYRETIEEATRLSLKPLQDIEEGKQITDAQRQQLQKAAVLFDRMTDYQATNIGTYVGAAKIYQALGDDDAAIRRLVQGLTIVPADPIPAVKDTAIEAHYILSVSYFNTRNYPAALTEINTSLSMFPKSPIYLAQRASIELQLRDYKASKDDLLAALKIDPEHKKSLSLLKMMMMGVSDEAKASAKRKLNAHDYKGVIADCTRGLKIDPLNVTLLALRAAANVELGNKDAARTDVDQILGIDPASADAKLLEKRLK